MENTPIVTITGVTGYVGSQVCLLFLKNGQFKVRGTVRSLAKEDKINPLKEAYGDLFNELELVEADLCDEASLMKAIEGATYVVHTASFIKEEKDYSLFEKPAIQGTLSICKACQVHKVKRLVCTSSVAAIMEKTDRSQTLFTVKDWSDPEELEKDKPYEKSKTLAEQAAWKFVEELPEGEKFELVTTLPGLVVGPNINKCHFTSGDMIKGFMMSDPDYEQLLKWHFPWVDVRDVALAHLNAILIPEAAGQRFMLVADQCHWWTEIGQWLDEVYGAKGSKQYNVSTQEITDKAIIDTLPADIQGVWGQENKYENESTKEVLKIEFTPIKKSVLDMAETLISTGYVPDLR